MIISFAWTTEALLAERKKVTRRDWSKEYAAKCREGTVQDAYDRLPRVHGKKVGNVRIARPPYPEATRNIPDEDFELEGLKYMEEKGLLIRGRTPREFFEDWRQSNQVLFVVHFGLVFPCDRCWRWTWAAPFGPYNTKRLCPLCWVDWSYYADGRPRQCNASVKSWLKVYEDFLVTERKVND